MDSSVMSAAESDDLCRIKRIAASCSTSGFMSLNSIITSYLWPQPGTLAHPVSPVDFGYDFSALIKGGATLG